MRDRPSLAAIVLFLVAVSAAAQPRRTECLQWDDAYNQIVLFGTIGAAAGALVLALFIGLMFGRRFWSFAAPRARIWVAALLIAYPFSLLTIVIWPRVFPLGRLIYSSVDPRYGDCQAMSFGAPGLFHGIIGQGIAALAQWQAISATLLVACALGGLVAWIISELMVRAWGLTTTAQGGEE